MRRLEEETEREADDSTLVYLNDLAEDLDRFAGEVRGEATRGTVHGLIVLIDWTVEACDGKPNPVNLQVALMQAALTLGAIV